MLTGEQFFRITIEKRGSNEKDRVASLKSVLIHLKISPALGKGSKSIHEQRRHKLSLHNKACGGSSWFQAINNLSLGQRSDQSLQMFRLFCILAVYVGSKVPFLIS